jgi:hypothetical protein
MTISHIQAAVIKYAAVSCAATDTEKEELAEYVVVRLVPVHISWTLNVPVLPSPGTKEKVKVLVAVVFEVLMTKTWVPRDDRPE